MPLHTSTEPLFIFNNENIRAYLADRHQDDQDFDASKPLSISDKRVIQNLKQRLFLESSTSNPSKFFNPDEVASRGHVHDWSYMFFVNPKAITESVDFDYDAGLILSLPQSLQTTLLESGTRWRKYSLSVHRNGFPFESLHVKAISLAFLNKVCHANGFSSALRSPNAPVLPKKILEQTVPVIASLKDFNLFLTLNKAPNPELAPYLKKVVIKDSFRKFYTSWQKNGADRLQFIDLSYYYQWPDAIKFKDPVLTEKGRKLLYKAIQFGAFDKNIYNNWKNPPKATKKLNTFKKEAEQKSREIFIDLDDRDFNTSKLIKTYSSQSEHANSVTVLSSLVWQAHPELFSFPKKGQPVPVFTNQVYWPDQLKEAFNCPNYQQDKNQELSYQSLPQSDEDVSNAPER